MDTGEAFGVEEIDSPLQRVVRRRRAFFALPIAATALAFLLIVWQVIRQNLPVGMLRHWPWKLSLLDLESATTVATVLAVFLFTRAQYAEAVRPVIGWSLHHASVHQRVNPLQGANDVLTLTVFNGGGGLAVVESFSYRFARHSDRSPTEWVPYERFHENMAGAGLMNLKDYYFEHTRAGYPLVPTVHDENLPFIGVIRIESLFRFRIFDIRIRVWDAVGDLHERVLPCRAVVRDSVSLHAFAARMDGASTAPRSWMRRLGRSRARGARG